jgi:hypothetical protein
LSKYLTQTFMSHCNEMICQQVTLSGYAEGPKVADAVIEAHFSTCFCLNQQSHVAQESHGTHLAALTQSAGESHRRRGTDRGLQVAREKPVAQSD